MSDPATRSPGMDCPPCLVPPLVTIQPVTLVGAGAHDRRMHSPPVETTASTKPESSHGLANVATRVLLLISREPMQKSFAHGSVGDIAGALVGVFVAADESADGYALLGQRGARVVCLSGSDGRPVRGSAYGTPVA